MKAFSEVRSVDVGTVIVKILAKLRDALKSPFVKRMEAYGLERANKLSLQALKWGYGEARSWGKDLGFAKYVTLLDMNTTSRLGV